VKNGIIDVGILADGDMIIKSIGEDLIKDNHKNINFYFLNETVSVDMDYLILNHKNKKTPKNIKCILLCENINDSGIFLFQAKAKIKTAILNIIGEEDRKNKFEVISGISPYNLAGATLFNQFISCELANEGHKICMLSLNINFPYKFLGWDLGNKGLLKAIYYYQNNESFNPGIISHHISEKYHYIEMDININESRDISEDLIKKLLNFLKIQEYRYVVLDYGIFYWQLTKLSDKIFYLQNIGNNLISELENNNLVNINNFTDPDSWEIIELEQLENIFVIKNERIIFNYDMEELSKWKRSLRSKLSEN